MTQQPRDTPQFFLTSPSPCPYIPGRQERKVFTHLVGERAPEVNDILTQGGFRRSQSIAYRPACEACRACVSVRVLAEEFEFTRAFRRVMSVNSDMIGHERTPTPTAEQYSLFRTYLDNRHADGGMVDMTVLDYSMMVEDSHVNTKLIEYRMRGPTPPGPSAAKVRYSRSRSRTSSLMGCRWSIRSTIRISPAVRWAPI